MTEAATPRQMRERTGSKLAALTRAQQHLAQQLAHAVGGDGLPGALADAAMLVFACSVSELYRILDDDLECVVRRGTPLAAQGQVDLSQVQSAADSGVAHLSSRLVPSADVPYGATELCAPVRERRGPAILRLVAAPGTSFDGEDLHLVAILAGHAATAAEAARLVTLQKRQRRRAEAAAALARVALHATLLDGVEQLIDILDRAVRVDGLALGVARARDGQIEYVGTRRALDHLRGQRAAPTRAPHGDPQTLVFPLTSRAHAIGELRVVLANRSPAALRRAGYTLERLVTPLALALDALLLDEEERLAREREHLLATALTTIDHPIFILDPYGIRYANVAASREYGWSQAELMEMRFEELVVGKDTREGLAENGGVAEPGIRVSHDVHRRRDGAEFPAAVNVSPLTGHDGEPLGSVVSVRDLTQDRHLEEQLRHTEKMVALGELVAGVAHEINNPLTGISAFAQLLLEESLTPDQLESVQLIKQETDRAKIVIRDLLLFARKTDRGFGPVDVNAMLQQVVRLRAYPLRVAGVTVQLELDATAPMVSGDEQKLQQVLLNLIANAESAMLDAPTRLLTLRTAGEEERVQIRIIDTGKGMTPDVRRRIFEPFFSTKPAGAGTGLGLSVSYGIVSAHGGTIAVDSEPEVGTTVLLTFPRLASPPLFAGTTESHGHRSAIGHSDASSAVSPST